MAENLEQGIKDLRQELTRIEAAIAALEALATGGCAVSGFDKRSTRGRKSMGTVERLAVSARITKYWADRRSKPQFQTA